MPPRQLEPRSRRQRWSQRSAAAAAQTEAHTAVWWSGRGGAGGAGELTCPGAQSPPAVCSLPFSRLQVENVHIFLLGISGKPHSYQGTVRSIKNLGSRERFSADNEIRAPRDLAMSPLRVLAAVLLFEHAPGALGWSAAAAGPARSFLPAAAVTASSSPRLPVLRLTATQQASRRCRRPPLCPARRAAHACLLRRRDGHFTRPLRSCQALLLSSPRRASSALRPVPFRRGV
jgi:hypothetical protein